MKHIVNDKDSFFVKSILKCILIEKKERVKIIVSLIIIVGITFVTHDPITYETKKYIKA